MNKMTMKNGLVLIMLLVTISLSAQRQGRLDDRLENMEARRVAFITTKLDLTSEQAQQFWPIFNEHRDEEQAIRKEQRELMRAMVDNDAKSKEMLDTYMDLEERRVVQMRERVNAMSGFLSYEQIAKLLRIEKEFVREVLKEVRSRRN